MRRAGKAERTVIQSIKEGYRQSGLGRKSLVIAVVFGALFACATALPWWADDSLTPFMSLMVGIGTFLVATTAVLLLAYVTRNASFKESGPAFSPAWGFFLACFVIIEVIFLLTLLSKYPGICTTDSNDVINQALGKSTYSNWHRYDGLSNHHPVFYTFLFWLVYKATSWAVSLKSTVFIFIFLQMTVFAGALAWSMNWLNRRCSSKALVGIVALVTCLNPVCAAFAIALFKDILFISISIVLVLRLFDFAQEGKPKARDWVLIAVLLLLMCLIRSNGLYVALIALVYIAFVFKGRRITALGIGAGLLAVMLVFQGPVLSAAGAQKGHFSETVGIPIQQIAAVAAAGGDMTPEQEEFVGQIMPVETMASSYRHSSVNEVKFSLDFNDSFLEDNKVDFLSNWAAIGMRNPGTYAKAWVQLTQGYWMPGSTMKVPPLWREGVGGIEVRSVLPFALDMSTTANVLRVVFPPLLSAGWAVWFMLTGIALIFMRYDRKEALRRLTCFVPLLALLLTLFVAAPISSDFRYAFPIYLTVPFLPYMCFKKPGDTRP